MAAKAQTIVVVKKKGGHGGHHGGAWKVAYADFVTAMMALFIVLWLMSSSEKVKQAVAGYFNDPKGTAKLLGTTMSGNGVVIRNDEALRRLKDKLEEEIKAKKELEKLAKQIEITITPEGLRIELLESKNGTFYQSGSAQLSDAGQELLALLAGELKTLPNSLMIEGHTDAAQYTTNGDYSNWELSADRANAARRLMQEDGVRSDQVTQIRGYADQMLRVKDNPYDPSNRRISILVKNQGDGAAPQITQGQAVGGTPAAGSEKMAPAAAQTQSASAAAAAKPGAAQPSGKTDAGKAVASKPEAGKAGLMGKLTAILPGKKK
jgi:chemotaxis protein MotB